MDRTVEVVAGYVAGAPSNPQVSIPPRGRFGPNYLKRLDCVLQLVITSGGANALLPGRRMLEAIQSLDFLPKQGDKIVDSISGWMLRALQWSMTNLAPLDPADLPANSPAGDYTFLFPFTISLADLSRKQPKDPAYVTGAFGQQPLTVNWQAVNYFGASTTIKATTQLLVTPAYEQRVGGGVGGTVDVAERIVFRKVGVNSWLNQDLPPGNVIHAFLLPIDGTAARAFSETSFTALSFKDDGDNIHSNTVPDHLIRAWNQSMPADLVSMLPTLDAAATEFIPLVWPQKKNSDQGDYARAAQKFTLDATIGAGAPDTNDYVVVIVQSLDPKDEDEAFQIASASPDIDQGTALKGLQIARAAGGDAEHAIVAHATNSKVPLKAQGVKGQLYRNIRQVVSPTNLAAAVRAAVTKVKKV